MIVGTVRRLTAIEHSISHLDAIRCNETLTARQESRLNRLVIEAVGLANSIGLRIYHQLDPRGCSLYLIDDTMDDTNYNNGLALS